MNPPQEFSDMVKDFNKTSGGFARLDSLGSVESLQCSFEMKELDDI